MLLRPRTSQVSLKRPTTFSKVSMLQLFVSPSVTVMNVDTTGPKRHRLVPTPSESLPKTRSTLRSSSTRQVDRSKKRMKSRACILKHTATMRQVNRRAETMNGSIIHALAPEMAKPFITPLVTARRNSSTEPRKLLCPSVPMRATQKL